MKRNQLLVLSLLAVLSPLFAQTSHAQRVRWSIGIGFGGPGYYRPWYGGHPWGPYPYYVPGPVVYEPAPIIVRPAPVIVQSAPAPAPLATPTPPSPVVPAQSFTPVSPQVDQLLRKLTDANDTVRRDAAMDLGRMKAQSGIDALTKLLSKDASPAVRDAAARALGLIASPRSLNALIYAAQADADRDVRHSAQFAVEIIRANLRGN